MLYVLQRIPGMCTFAIYRAHGSLYMTSSWREDQSSRPRARARRRDDDATTTTRPRRRRAASSSARSPFAILYARSRTSSRAMGRTNGRTAHMDGRLGDQPKKRVGAAASSSSLSPPGASRARRTRATPSSSRADDIDAYISGDARRCRRRCRRRRRGE